MKTRSPNTSMKPNLSAIISHLEIFVKGVTGRKEIMKYEALSLPL
jgi:hypothetical protein